MNNYIAFVYKWTDHLTGMFYIGCHLGSVDDGYVASSKVFNPIYLERSETFTREILSLHESYKEARIEEIKFLTEVDACRNPLYYNRSNGGNKGFNCTGHSEETIEKMSGKTPWNKGIPNSIETRNKISESNKGSIPWNKGKTGIKLSKETIEKMSGRVPWNKGIPRTQECKDKISKSKKGKTIITEETKEKMSGKTPWNKGKKDCFSEETLKKISATHKGKIPWNKGVPHTEETREKCRIASTGKKVSDETKAKMRISNYLNKLNKMEPNIVPRDKELING